MPSWLSILVTVIIAVLTVFVNTAVNIRIKFAPTAEVAARDVKLLLLRISQWVSNAAMVVILARDLLSPDPVTRWVVFRIALSVITLILALYWVGRLVDLIAKMTDQQRRHLDVTRTISQQISK